MAVERYEDIDLNFQGSREGNLLKARCPSLCTWLTLQALLPFRIQPFLLCLEHV